MSQGDLFELDLPPVTRSELPPDGPRYVLRRLHPWKGSEVLETAYVLTPFDAWVLARDWRAEKAILVLEVVTPAGEKLGMDDVLGPFRRAEFRGGVK